jgi:integrase
MSQRLRRRGKIWYATVIVDGVRRECSTGCTDEEAARTVQARWERDAADPDRGAENTTLNDALNRWLGDCRARMRNGAVVPMTEQAYTRYSGHLVRVFGHDLTLTNFKTAAAAADFIHTRRGEGASDATIKKELFVLRGTLRFAKESGLWFGDVGTAIPGSFRPEYKPKERVLTRAELVALVPHLAPDAAAAVCFIVATSAEDAALRAAMRADLPDASDPQPRVHVRGTKNARRDRLVPIVTDEQRTLLEFTSKHAQGKGGRLFGNLQNFRRDLARAAELAKVPHLWPHALRKAAGQFLIDLGVPLELVSRVMGHVDTRVTETIYAKVRQEDLGNRMLDAIDPRYAGRAIAARGKKKRLKTITKLPDPKAGPKLYEVAGVSRTLAGWAKARGMSKGTLYNRVVERGMNMAAALALSTRTGTSSTSSTAAMGTCQAFEADTLCRTGAANKTDTGEQPGQILSESGTAPSEKPRKKQGFEVPRDGIEPPTRGFSILCSTN